MWSHFPDCTNEEIRNALDKSAQDLGSSGKDNTFGFGLVQTLKALDYIDANPCKVHTTCPALPEPDGIREQLKEDFGVHLDDRLKLWWTDTEHGAKM